MGISLSHARYEEIKQIVVDLFVKYDVSCVPVNGFELATKMLEHAEKLGVKIIYDNVVNCKFDKERGRIFGREEYRRMVHLL